MALSQPMPVSVIRAFRLTDGTVSANADQRYSRVATPRAGERHYCQTCRDRGWRAPFSTAPTL